MSPDLVVVTGRGAVADIAQDAPLGGTSRAVDYQSWLDNASHTVDEVKRAGGPAIAIAEDVDKRVCPSRRIEGIAGAALDAEGDADRPA
jgi:hypothetical protein